MFPTLNDQPVTRARVHITPAGVWWGSLELDAPAAVVGAARLRIGTLELVGTVRRGGAFKGAAGYRIDGGAAAWSKELEPKPYRTTVGSVRLSLLLADLQRETGETIAPGYTDREVGLAFVRERAPAARILAQLVGLDGWHVGYDGRTVIGARPGGDVRTDYQVLDFEAGEGIATIAAEDLAGFAPGKSILVAGVPKVIGTLLIDLDANALRLTAWTSSTLQPDRLLAANRWIARETSPNQTFLGIYEYRVASQTGDVLDLKVVETALGLPDLPKVPLRPGVPGCRPTLPIGSSVLVQFVNGSPTRPVIAGFEGPDGAGFVPLELGLTGDVVRLADGELAVARKTDGIQGGHLLQDTATFMLFWAPDIEGSAGVYVPVATFNSMVVGTPPAPGTTGTPIIGAITGGREEVLA